MAKQSDRRRMIEIIRTRSFSAGGEVKLVSGRTSSFYFNMKPSMLDPEGATLIANAILDAIADVGADYIGGLEMGAVPLATAAAVASHGRGRPIAAFFVRKQAKDHGAQKLVEGLAPGATLNGKRVVIVEDVTTTGGSSLKAVEAVTAEGGKVVCVITVVDRLEGATDTFRKAGLVFRPLLTVEDFK